jgi:aldose 1-epimerase
VVDDLVTLRAGRLELALSPAVGGSIARFDHVADGRRTPILRGCDGVPDHALGAGSFPLVPYVNRIRGGRFTFRGRTVTLPLNMTGDASPLHGDGWLGAWEIAEASERSAVLRFAHAAGDWPWAYEAEQRFTLGEDGLEVTLSCTNRADEPMPAGLGQHPYFHCGPATRIETGVETVWTIDEKVLPVEQVPAIGRFDLSDRAVCGLGLDHGFGGWSGSTRLSDPSWPFAVTMSSPDARFFQLYSPEQGGIFVAEPVTHANAALNAPEEDWSKLGLRVLEPGEAMTLTMGLAVS